jgi:probable DNA metabolism protein
MITVVYDGSMEGFLCAVFDVYEYKFLNCSIVREKHYEGNLFAKKHQVFYNPEHSCRVWKALKHKLSARALKDIERTFLSESKGIENVLLRYIQYVFSSPKNIEHDYSHEAVLAVSHSSKKVHREAHRMEAFIRFQKTLDGLYYATIDPDHNVLPLIIEHFKRRFADQQWLIYDTGRGYGLHYNLQEVQQVKIQFSQAMQDGNFEAVYSADEAIYQQLWQQYFHSVNIKARKNLKLQLQHMPKRYWKNMIEIKPR